MTTADTTVAPVTELFPASDTLRSMGSAAVALSGLYAQWLRGLTINAHERLAIAHLYKTGPMTMSELGARIPLSRAAITALTDRLEALGYVTRTPDLRDRRRTVLSLTTRPGALMQGLTVPFTDDLAAIEGEFDEHELGVVRRFADALATAAERHAGQLRARGDAELPVPG